MEVAGDGSIRSFPIPQLPPLMTALRVGGLAITDAGEVFLSMSDIGAHAGYSVFTLDRTSGGWLPVDMSQAGASGNWLHLYGTSGSDLVVQVPGDSYSTVRSLTAKR
jgi:hypothetical protein